MSNPASTSLALRLTDITKSFGQETVLDHVSLSLCQGEICCLMGENGAGKTTLMRIISGLIRMDSGSIRVNGQPVNNLTPRKAQELGIHIVSQQPELVPMMSVEDNVFLGRELSKPGTRFINHAEQLCQLQTVLQMMDWDLDPNRTVESLSPMEQRIVDLAKALVSGSTILIFDELSAMADAIQLQKIHRLIHRLVAQGLSIIYISHDLEECRQLSRRLVILKGGKIVQDYADVRQLSMQQLVSHLTGETHLNRYPKAGSHSKSTILLQTQHLCCRKTGLSDINFKVRAGEIIGIAGLENCGHDSLFRLLTGMDQPSEGKILIRGKSMVFPNPESAAKCGISSASPETNDYLFLEMDSYFNVAISNLKRVAKTVFVHPHQVRQTVHDYLANLGTVPKHLLQSTGTLSQGERHKVSLAKMMFSRGQIYIMNNPSISLDIVSKVELYNAINWLAYRNHAVLILSSNVEELVGMCDGVYLMRDKRIVRELRGAEKSVPRIMHYMTDPSYTN